MWYFDDIVGKMTEEGLEFAATGTGENISVFWEKISILVRFINCCSISCDSVIPTMRIFPDGRLKQYKTFLELL